MIKVTVINGSPRKKNGNTEFILNPFIIGMKKAGGIVNVYYPSDMKIKSCIGNLDCWGENKGKCIIIDEMQDIYPILKESDILVLASPVYIPLPAMMQNFINRICPLLNPELKFEEGRTRIKFHEDVKISKIVGVISSGWWEIENLDIVLNIFEEFAKISRVEFIGAIRRPHSSLLKADKIKNHEILTVLESLGKQLIEKGQMDKKDLEFVSQPLINEPDYRDYLNDVHS